MDAPIRIVGCGRWSMGDDRLGLLAAEALRTRNLPDCDIRWTESPGTDLIADLTDDVRLLMLIDAAPADDLHPTGGLARIDYRREYKKLSGVRSKGDTHTLSPAEALELGTGLGVLPENVWVYIVFGCRFGRAFTVTPEAQAGIGKTVSRIEDDARCWLAEYRKTVGLRMLSTRRA